MSAKRSLELRANQRNVHSMSAFEERFQWSLRRTSESRRFKRLVLRMTGAIDEERPDDRDVLVNALSVIALVEMTERPTAFRFGEWIVSWMLGRWKALTLGPYQLRGARWRDADATRSAAAKLLGATSTPDLSDQLTLQVVAELWNGSAERQPGAEISYVSALYMAHGVLAETCCS